MDHKLVSQWLGLPSAAWPPDHYTLLGLTPGESDLARIEQHTQERLARVRCYQLPHPEQATEAMNRLARAFACLSDPQAKKRYDATLGLADQSERQVLEPRTAAVSQAPEMVSHAAGGSGGHAVLAALPPPGPVDMDDTAVNPRPTQVDWASEPPPIRAAALTDSPTPLTDVAPPAPLSLAPGAVPPAQPGGLVSVGELADPVLEIARSSREARRGLGTRRGLYRRLLLTRELLRAWDLAGKYVGRSKRRLSRLGEEKDLVRRLAAMEELLAKFPGLLGQPGQPGYRIVMLAQDEDTVGMFKTMTPPERVVFELDWRAGRAVLLAHRRFVGDEVRRLRRQPRWRRLARPCLALVKDHPIWTLLVWLILAAATRFMMEVAPVALTAGTLLVTASLAALWLVWLRRAR